MKLISMTDYILNMESENTNPSLKGDWARYNQMVDYAKFLKQPLELWMFVPCGEDGMPLELFQATQEDIDDPDTRQVKKDEFHAYHDAKDRVLFQDWGNWFDNNASLLLDVCLDMDSLVLYEVTLTPNAIKQLGL